MESIVAFFEARSIEVVGREFPQVLLLHANQLNADLMPDLLAMFRRRGYTFVSLDRALADEAYRLPDDYAGRGRLLVDSSLVADEGHAAEGRARSAGVGTGGDGGAVDLRTAMETRFAERADAPGRRGDGARGVRLLRPARRRGRARRARARACSTANRPSTRTAVVVDASRTSTPSDPTAATSPTSRTTPASSGSSPGHPTAADSCFATALEDNDDLYVIDRAGSRLERVGQTPGLDGAASWSPDSTRIVFERERLGEFVLYTATADGSNPEPLVRGSTPRLVSPRRHNRLSRPRSDGDMDLWLIGDDGTNARPLVAEDGDQLWASWSPDASAIAFSVGGTLAIVDLDTATTTVDRRSP